MNRHSSGILVAVSMAFLAVMIAVPAAASHYDIASAGIVEEQMAAKMESLGIGTTRDLLEKTATPKASKALAGKLGVKASVVAEWRDFCDLLRIDGVGPKVARMLTLVGVRNLKALASRSPRDMVRAIKAENEKVSVLGKLPDEDNLADWIGQAKAIIKKDAERPARKGKVGKPAASGQGRR